MQKGKRKISKLIHRLQFSEFKNFDTRFEYDVNKNPLKKITKISNARNNIQVKIIKYNEANEIKKFRDFCEQFCIEDTSEIRKIHSKPVYCNSGLLYCNERLPTLPVPTIAT